MDSNEKALYFEKLYLDEYAPDLEALPPELKRNILTLVRTTNIDGPARNEHGQKKAHTILPTGTSAQADATKSSNDEIKLCGAIDPALDPYKKYISGPNVNISEECSVTTNTSASTSKKRNHGGIQITKSNTVCIHCKLPSSQCVEKLFGLQMLHYFKKSASYEGIIDYPLHRDDSREVDDTIREDFRRLLSHLKFSVAVMNGTTLPSYPGLANNPFVTQNLQSEEWECDDVTLPDCVIKGSYTTFLDWLDEKQEVFNWNLNIYDGMDELPEIPQSVINHYRAAIEK